MKTFIKVIRLVHLALATFIAMFMLLGEDENAAIAALLASFVTLLIYGDE